MVESIRKLKLDLLTNLKTQRAELDSKKASILAQKYAEKKANINIEISKLQETLNSAITQKQARANERIEAIRQELNDDIAKTRQEVTDKIKNYDLVAKAEAEAETEAEVAHALRDFDTEISKLEKELN